MVVEPNLRQPLSQEVFTSHQLINHNSIMPKLLLFSRPLHGGLTVLFLFLTSALFAQLNVSVEGEDILCFGLSSGTATATVSNGTAPFSYAWSNGGSTAAITNLNAGTYGVTVTDANNISGTASVTLSEPSRVTATITDPTECEGPFTIAAEPQGGVTPYRYNWSTGADTRGVSVPAGDYCVTVVDANLCGYVACTTIEENPPSVTVVGVDAQCFGDDDGAITANPAGGTAPYSYAWSNGGVGQTISGLSPGVYRVTLTDARGCTATAATTVSEPTEITGNIFGDNSVCPGESDAFIRINPTGGTPPYSYNWSPGGFTGQGIGPLSSGTYRVTVTDANECEMVRSYVITESSDVSVAITGDDLLCGATSTGTLTAAPVSGPVSQYTYGWSNGGNGPTISNVGAGTYTVTATDANGCTGTATATIRVIDLNVSLSSTPVSCNDGSDGTATATVSGGDAPYEYDWSNGMTTATISGLTAGTYRVTITEANNCKVTGQVTIVEPNDLQLSIQATDISCNGDNDGALDLSVSGGTPGYTYQWSNGATSQDLNGLAAGTYTVTVTDANGCTDVTSGTVREPAGIIITPIVTDVDCNGDENGRIALSVDGGNAPFSYQWNTGQTSRVITDLTSGTYTVTVTDANECTATGTYNVDEPALILVTGQETNVNCFNGNDGSINLTASGGTAPYSYRWSNGRTTQDISGLTAGTYTVAVTDANGCEQTASFTIQQPTAIALTAVTDDVNCNGGSDGSINASVSGGTPAYSYAWSNGALTEDITNLSAGTYTLTVTDANGCTAMRSFTVGAPAAINATARVEEAACFEESTGSIDLTVSGGTTPYTYAWSNGPVTQDISGLAAGDYSVTVTDANNCSVERSFTVTQRPDIVVTGTATPSACNDDASGSIDISVSGGTAPYTYVWSNGRTTQDISGLTAGTYMVSITDANGCFAGGSLVVDEPTDIVVSGIPTDANCFNGNDGSINLTVSGGSAPYSYGWSNGQTTEDISGLSAGTYRVTVTDANECEDITTYTIGQPTAIGITATVEDVSCNGDSDGSIDASVSGGTQPYSFAWSNGAATEDIGNLSAGTYTLTVTDANGCTANRSFTVGQPSAIAASAQVTDVACEGDATGAINLSVSGGVSPYSYLWSNGATTQDISDLVAGDYTVTITDSNRCATTRSFTVGAGSTITVSGTANAAACNNEATGSVDISVSGGTAPYAYRWSNGATTQDISGLAAGTYTVAVTDANGCMQSGSFTVDQPGDVNLAITAPTITCGGTATGSITVLPSGGTPPYTYQWSNGAVTPEITNVPAGLYMVTVTDANGCSEVTTGISLSELPQLSCNVVIDQPATSGNDGQLSVDIDGGTAPYSYVWSNNATTPTISNLAAGTYSVTITDANGCTTECTGTLQAFSGIGDYVWEDWNVNGQQDPGEPGISDYPVYLKNAAGVIIDSTRTDENGFYSFMGLIPGDYSILFPEAPGGIRTIFNSGNDATDNDADPSMNGMTQVYNLEPGEFNMTVDAGFFAEPNGEITDPCNCLNNATDELNGQFSEVVEIVANPGQTWTIIAAENMFSTTSAAPPAAPTPIAIGTVLPQVGLFENFDELAIYRLDLFLVDSLPYSVTLSNGVYELTLRNQCFYPVVRYVETPPDSLCRFDPTFDLNGFGLLNNQPLAGNVSFTIGGVAATEIDPMALPVGPNVITAQFTPSDPDECVVEAERIVVIVDECDAKLGNFVFEDINGNGVQDAGEPGIPGVKVTVTSQDGTYMDMTTTDENGFYCFFVPPGTYKITFEQPEDFVPTTPNAGVNDELDSDMDPAMLMTGFYTVGPDEENLTIDAGFINPCRQNVSNPGTIAQSQTLCGPGNVPQPFTEIAPASGGVGQIEYLWMYNTEDAGQDISYWQAVPNSNSPNFAPGPIYETTYFVRCVRRNNCPYIEGNVLTVEVGNDAVADVSGPSSICVGEDAIFQAVNPGAGARFSWTFSGSATVTSSTQPTVTTSWQTFGNFSATLTVTRNGCVSTQVFNVSVLNSPTRCGGNLTASGAVNNLQLRDVMIEWQVPADGTEYAFELERSTDGQNFSPVATVTTPDFVSSGNMAIFRQGDISPLAGRNFYRVRMMDAEYGDMLSNVVEMQLAGTSASLGRIFPNPAREGMIHVEMTEESDVDLPTSVQLYDVRGNSVGPRQYLRPGAGIINLPTTNVSAGVYFLRMMVGDRTETHRVILE